MFRSSDQNKTKVSVGIIGYGYIGQQLVSRLRADPERFDIAFVHTRRRDKAVDISDELFLADLDDAASRQADIIIETAHPIITQRYGLQLINVADYMPLSTSALTDKELHNALLQIARISDTRLILAAGALIGGEELIKRSIPWARARITFRKHPKNIDFSNVDFVEEEIKAATTVFDGSVREIASLYPRNVNTMVTAALLSTGVDACEGVLVADPNLNCAIAEVEAWGEDGSYIRTEKKQPAMGVSGTEMIDSVWHSILQANGFVDGAQLLV